MNDYEEARRPPPRGMDSSTANDLATPRHERTILVHLNVTVPEGDLRSADEIQAAISMAIQVGSDHDYVRDLDVVVALAEEV